MYVQYGFVQGKPFYREVWFVVALAAASIVIIIMVVAILCVKSKTYKYKGETVAHSARCLYCPPPGHNCTISCCCLARLQPQRNLTAKLMRRITAIQY